MGVERLGHPQLFLGAMLYACRQQAHKQTCSRSSLCVCHTQTNLAGGSLKHCKFKKGSTFHLAHFNSVYSPLPRSTLPALHLIGWRSLRQWCLINAPGWGAFDLEHTHGPRASCF